jgi:Domain of unknown function (DUF4407)
VTQPATPGANPSGGHGRPRRFSDVLARLGGADLDVLRSITRERVRDRFVQMALVLLSTAGLAVLSMSFALHDGLDLHPVVAVACGLAWGFIILNIDRMLILNLSARGGFRRTAAVVVPRIVIAALLGLVISTPLVLRVFQTEIQAQIVTTNTKANATFGQDVNATGNAQELQRVRDQIAKDEAAQRGEVAAVVTPEVQSRQDYLTQAQNTLDQKRQKSDQLYRKLQCELYGTQCEGSSGRTGNGPLARALQGEYDTAIAETNAAQNDVNTAKAALDKARQDASTQDADAVRNAQETANSELPGLRAREAELQKAYNTALDNGNDRIRDDDGILAQIVALNQLGKQNVEALFTHISVGLLFFMIELLPVLVKIMTSIGAPSLYDRVRELDDNRVVDDAKIAQRRATKQRDDDERRALAETKKLRAIEDDMRDRERKLGFRANEHVEKEMVRILDAALSQWSANVQQTLQNGVVPGTVVNGTVVNGAALNGAALNGTAVNGGAVNGAAVNGAAVNGVGVNGAAVNGTAPVNGTGQHHGATGNGTQAPAGHPQPFPTLPLQAAAQAAQAPLGPGPTVPLQTPVPPAQVPPAQGPTVSLQAGPQAAQVPAPQGPTVPLQTPAPPASQTRAAQQAAQATVRSNFNLPNGNKL